MMYQAGLVLEGGALRTIFSSGVCDILPFIAVFAENVACPSRGFYLLHIYLRFSKKLF